MLLRVTCYVFSFYDINDLEIKMEWIKRIAIKLS